MEVFIVFNGKDNTIEKIFTTNQKAYAYISLELTRQIKETDKLQSQKIMLALCELNGSYNDYKQGRIFEKWSFGTDCEINYSYYVKEFYVS